LGTIVAGVAGTLCLLPASGRHSTLGECHSGRIPARVPSHPQPADYRCCSKGNPAALLTNGFSPRPALQALKADAIPVLVAAGSGVGFPSSIDLTGGPPGVFILRI